MKCPDLILLASITMTLVCGCAAPSGNSVSPNLVSGLQKGDDIESWNPIHVAGPNKGTNACPVCSYLALPAVVIFTRDGANAGALATKLQSLVVDKKDMKLKGFLVVLDSSPEKLKQMSDDLSITQIGVCYPDPATRDKDLALYKINPAAENTVMIYKDYKVKANFVDLDVADFNKVTAVVNGLN